MTDATFFTVVVDKMYFLHTDNALIETFCVYQSKNDCGWSCQSLFCLVVLKDTKMYLLRVEKKIHRC